MPEGGILQDGVDKFYKASCRGKRWVRGNGGNGDMGVFGKINSSQDGVIVTADMLAPCLTSGHGNCPKVIVYESDTEKGKE